MRGRRGRGRASTSRHEHTPNTSTSALTNCESNPQKGSSSSSSRERGEVHGGAKRQKKDASAVSRAPRKASQVAQDMLLAQKLQNERAGASSKKDRESPPKRARLSASRDGSDAGNLSASSGGAGRDARRLGDISGGSEKGGRTAAGEALLQSVREGVRRGAALSKEHMGGATHTHTQAHTHSTERSSEKSVAEKSLAVHSLLAAGAAAARKRSRELAEQQEQARHALLPPQEQHPLLPPQDLDQQHHNRVCE